MKFMDLSKKLKDEIKPLYNLNGGDAFLIQKAVAAFKSTLIKDFEEFDYIKLDAEKLKAENVYEQIVTLPLGNEKRLIVLVNPNTDIVKMVNSLDIEQLGNVIVCVNATGLNKCEEIECSKIDKSDIAKFVLTTLAKTGHSIEELALDYLIEVCSSDMMRISNEINKLIAYCEYDKIITHDVVVNLVNENNEYAVFMLTNAIDKKDFSAYTKILNQMKKSLSSGEIYSYLGKYFKRMQYIALNKDDAVIAKILNIKPYAVQKSREYISSNGVKFYLHLYEKYIELDELIKSGKISAANALYELIF